MIHMEYILKYLGSGIGWPHVLACSEKSQFIPAVQAWLYSTSFHFQKRPILDNKVYSHFTYAQLV